MVLHPSINHQKIVNILSNPGNQGLKFPAIHYKIYSVGSHDMRSFFKAVKAKEGAQYVDQRKTEQEDRQTDS